MWSKMPCWCQESKVSMTNNVTDHRKATVIKITTSQSVEWLLWVHSTRTVGLQIDLQKHWFSTISGSMLPSIVAEATKQPPEKQFLVLMRFIPRVWKRLFLEDVHLICRFYTLHFCSCWRWKYEEPRINSCCLTEADLDLYKQTTKTNSPSSRLQQKPTVGDNINLDITSGCRNEIVSSPLNLYLVSWLEPLCCN